MVAMLFSVATINGASGVKMSVPLAVPSDPKAKYTLLELGQVTDRIILVTTLREGITTSYPTRVIDCGRMRFKYLAEGDTFAELKRNKVKNQHKIKSGKLSRLNTRLDFGVRCSTYLCGFIFTIMSPPT